MPDIPGLPPGFSFSGLPFASFGETLRGHRIVRGMSVEQLATAANVAPSAIRAIEGGERVSPPAETIKSLADALNLSKDERSAFMTVSKLTSPFLSAILPRPASSKPAPLSAAIFTFLIADVRGYTHFTQDQGDEAAARLTTRFAELIQSVIEQWDGRLIELRGDEALVVFASVRQALQAAISMQEHFAEEVQRNPDLPLQVGIGLDVGEAVPVDEGYRGAALNRAARLCSVAGAGDVLVTKGLVYVVSKVEGIAFHERGTMALKGFDTPVEMLCVVREKLLDAGMP